MMAALASALGATANGDDVRVRVLDAAEHLFAERGYAGATTRMIAAQAGIQKRMLFYYYPNKDALYRAVLERIVTSLVDIHQQFRDDPGPVGLAEAVAGITYFVAARPAALRVLVREIMDAGPHLATLAREHLAPLFARGADEMRRNMATGVFRPADPMQVLMNVGGVTLYYFLMIPLLRLVWDRDPLAPAALAERAAAVQDLLMHGLAGPGLQGGMPS